MTTKKQLRELAVGELEKRVVRDACSSDRPVQYLDEVSEHGCQSGIVSGLTYYTDTCKFYEKHKDEIWGLIEEGADNDGVSMMKFITNLNGGKDIGGVEQFENLLAWFGYEQSAMNIRIRM
jgi:hypothetical protein